MRRGFVVVYSSTMTNRENRRNRRTNARNNHPANGAKAPQDFKRPNTEIQAERSDAERKQAQARDALNQFTGGAQIEKTDDGGLRLDLSEERRAIPIQLGAETYTCFPPKIGVLLSMFDEMEVPESQGTGSVNDMKNASSMVDVIDGWVEQSFSEKDARRIFQRLDDNNDPLDITHIFMVLENVMEVDTKNPTM